MSIRDCHKGPKLLLDKGGVELYGASYGEAQASYYNFDLVISLSGLDVYRGINPIFKGSSLKSIRLAQLVGDNSPEVLSIDWPDIGIPKMSKEYWEELVKLIKKRGRDRERRGNKYRIMVHCLGGHGRTGTAMAILVAKLTGATKYYNKDYSIEYKDIVEYIRMEYCKSAVESTSQLGYIEDMTGLKVISTVTRHVYVHDMNSSFSNKIKELKLKKKVREVLDDIPFDSTDIKIPIDIIDNIGNSMEEVEYNDKAIEERYKYGCIKHNKTYCWDCYKEEIRILKDRKSKVN